MPSKGMAFLFYTSHPVHSNMKTIVLENGWDVDIPNNLRRYLISSKIDWELLNTTSLFYPENLNSTLELFSSFPYGQEFIADTYFYYQYQLERGIQLLYSLKDKNFKIQFISSRIPHIFLKYLKETESGITPKLLLDSLDYVSSDEEYNEIYSKIENFKQEMNEKFFQVLLYHQIYIVDPLLDEPKRLLSFDDLKSFSYET